MMDSFEFNDAGVAFLCSWMGQDNFQHWMDVKLKAEQRNPVTFISWLLSLADVALTPDTDKYEAEFFSTAEKPPQEHRRIPDLPQFGRNPNGMTAPRSEHSHQKNSLHSENPYEQDVGAGSEHVAEKFGDNARNFVKCEIIDDFEEEELEDLAVDTENMEQVDVRTQSNGNTNSVTDSRSHSRDLSPRCSKEIHDNASTHPEENSSITHASFLNVPSVLNIPGQSNHVADNVDDGLQFRNMISCDLCNYKTMVKGHYLRHLRVHSTERPFKCDAPNCGYRSKFNFTMNRHKRTIHKVDNENLATSRLQLPLPKSVCSNFPPSYHRLLQ